MAREPESGSPDKNDLLGFFPQELEELMVKWGEPRYRGRQLFQWLHKQRVRDFAVMTNLPKVLRERLAQELPLIPAERLQVQTSPLDETVKFLLRLKDGETVETVLLHYEYGYTVCVSSQVGCALGCTFCASSLGGFRRDLTAGEMIEQVLAATDFLAKEHGSPAARVGHIVVMGMGEPLLNYDQVLRFLRLAHEPEGLNISYRHMTISTAGIVPGIRRLAREDLPVTLAISLHAPNDDLRRRLMPVAQKYPLDELFAACREYVAITGRRITFEYALISGVNDRPEHALELAQRLGNMLAHVNLIPLNPVPERGYERSPAVAVEKFQKILLRAGIEATVRRELGTEIDAACGQLRRRFLSDVVKMAGEKDGSVATS